MTTELVKIRITFEPDAINSYDDWTEIEYDYVDDRYLIEYQNIYTKHFRLVIFRIQESVLIDKIKPNPCDGIYYEEKGVIYKPNEAYGDKLDAYRAAMNYLSELNGKEYITL